MQISGEIRWFWSGGIPSAFEDWFRRGGGDFLPGGPEKRVDEYLLDPNQAELGLKKRGSKPGIEVKGLLQILQGAIRDFPFTGDIQLWSKWSSEILSVNGLVTLSTQKTRLIRKYDTGDEEPREVRLNQNGSPTDPQRRLPSEGCNVELTHISLDGAHEWWTFGFEAFGSLGSVASNLTRTVGFVARRKPPMPAAGKELSYPAWLRLPEHRVRP